MTFEAAPPAAFAPHEIHTFSTPNDPHDFLPPGSPQNSPQKKWTALVQRAIDAHNAVPEFAVRKEAAEAVTVIQRRIADLTRLKSEGGAYGLSDDAASVLAERKKLERAISERDRQQTLYEIRSARWNTCMQLRGAASDWVLRGVPQNCVIEATEDQPISELLKKGERIADAVERYRHRLREGAADLHRLRSRAWPSALQMEKAEAQVQQWAEAGAPDLDSMIEHNAPLTFPMVSLSSFVRGTASTRFRRDHKFSWGSMLAGPRPDAGEDQGRSE